MKNINNAFILLISVMIFYSCYDDSYLDPKLDKSIAYFASFTQYNRTLVVGEGLQFKIGAAMAGVLENTEDRTLQFTINKYSFIWPDGRVVMPDSLYNSSELNGVINAVIPKGKFLGYFTVKMDSLRFLNDSLSLMGKYTLPVKLIATSLDSIGKDSVLVSVKYICGVHGYYLNKSIIKKEVNGAFIESKTITEEYKSEGDNYTWLLNTVAPFKALATPPTTSFMTGLKFNLIVQNNAIEYESITGQPVVTATSTNSYNSKTRDFELNYKYQKPGNDTIYHINSKLIFRNRVRDNINETRDYLLSLYK